MPDLLWIKALAKALLLPPTGLLMVALLGALAWRRHPRLGRWLAAGSIVALLVLSIPAVAWLLLQAVESSPTFDPVAASRAQAVVILGGGTRRNAEEYGGDTLGRLTLERVRYGARIARETGLPVLVSGGAVLGSSTEASLMADALENEFGVPVRWREDRSRNTHENAQRTSEMLRADGVTRAVLVAHGFDMRRAEAEFRTAGLDIVPAPTVLAGEIPTQVLDYVPSMGGLQGSYYALYEILGNAARVLDR